MIPVNRPPSRPPPKGEGEERPYLSVVATARNDDHGGNLLGRMQLFIDGLLAQCDRFQLPAELILVEWNPPGDRPGLREPLKWPAPGRHGKCAVRIIQVPREVHGCFKHAEALPLFQMIAKNVGVRRALGAFVLATNIDILFSNELVEYLARRKLDAGRMYRVNRYDVDPTPPGDADPDKRLDHCRTHVVRINGRDGSANLRTGDFHRIYWRLTPRVRLLEALQDWNLVPTVTRKRLHLNACGDFTLMSRDKWFELRGYPEFEMYSMHLDSVLCTAAHFGGARELVLPEPMRCYHIEHGQGSGWSPEGEQRLNERLAKAGIPQLGHDQFHKWAVQMRRDGKPIIFNGSEWGLGGEEFEDLAIG